MHSLWIQLCILSEFYYYAFSTDLSDATEPLILLCFLSEFRSAFSLDSTMHSLWILLCILSKFSYALSLNSTTMHSLLYTLWFKRCDRATDSTMHSLWILLCILSKFSYALSLNSTTMHSLLYTLWFKRCDRATDSTMHSPSRILLEISRILPKYYYAFSLNSVAFSLNSAIYSLWIQLCILSNFSYIPKYPLGTHLSHWVGGYPPGG
jgi:hypothetical protein